MVSSREPPLVDRRHALTLLGLATAGLAWPRPARAEGAVPAGLQASLLAKTASYDKGFAGRAGDHAVVLLFQRSGAESRAAAAEMRAALASIPQLGGLPHSEEIVDFGGAAAAAEVCKQKRAAIAHFGAGFGDDVGAIRGALTGMNILSVAGAPDYVPGGIVLGFDLVEGKPKLYVHLTQAKAQGVEFRAEVLKLMKVFE
jgi:hypothetical protein